MELSSSRLHDLTKPEYRRSCLSLVPKLEVGEGSFESMNFYNAAFTAMLVINAGYG